MTDLRLPATERRGPRTPELVSVIIPMHNAQHTIGAQLAALSEQDYDRPWEVIVVDNQSTDGSSMEAARWADRFERFRLCDAADGKGVSFARNRGMQVATGDLFAFCDADDLAQRGWLSGLVEGAASADIVGGGQVPVFTNEHGEIVERPYRPRKQRDRRPFLGFLPFAVGGNVAVWRDVAEAVGGWSTEFLRGQDVEFSWRVQIAGYRFVSAPQAIMRYRGRHSVGEALRQHHVWGMHDARLVAVHRQFGCPQTPWPVIAKRLTWLTLHTVDLGRSRWHRLRYLKVAVRCAGKFRGSLQNRVRVL